MSGSCESVRWNACVHRLDLSLYSHPEEFWGNGVTTHVHFNGKIPSTRTHFPTGGSNPRHCIKQDSEPNTLPTSYFPPSPHPICCLNWLFTVKRMSWFCAHLVCSWRRRMLFVRGLGFLRVGQNEIAEGGISHIGITYHQLSKYDD